MSRYRELSDRIATALELALPPVAITFTDEVPAGVPAHQGSAPAGCRFWQDAARGAFATAARDYELCAIGVHTHNLSGASPTQPTELAGVLAVMAGLDYVRADEVPGIPVVRSAKRHVVYAPLAEAPLPPDVVVVFAHDRQGLVLSEALSSVDGGTPPAMGRPACAALPAAMNSGKAALSLGCCGARAYLDVMTDGVSMWALPGPRLEAYAERLTSLAHANRVLGRFHALRRQDVEAGGRPTLEQSLARLSS